MPRILRRHSSAKAFVVVLGGYGGGIYNGTQLQLTLINCTVTNNQTGAGGFGGGIRSDAPAADLKDSLVANNHTDVDGATGPDLYGNFHSLDYNLIRNPSGATFTGTTTHNLVGVDPLLGPLTNNGGASPTHALRVGSPAIDAGNSTEPADQRGQPRPVDDRIVANAAGGNASDIGAYEAHNLEVNSTAEADDTICSHLGEGNGCTLREAVNAANAQPGAEVITFSPALTAGGPTTISLLIPLQTLASDMAILGPGAGLLTVERSHVGGTADFRIFKTVSGYSVTLSGLTIANGAATGAFPENLGGNILNDQGMVQINNCVIKDAVAGGGVGNFGGSMTINDSTLSSNAGNAAVTNTVPSSSSATRPAPLTINNSTITGNSGGGVNNSVVIGNATSPATVTINNSTIFGNNINSTGGSAGVRNGVGAGGTGIVTINNSTISNNTNADGSGAVYNAAVFIGGSTLSTARVTINNSTIAGNDGGTAPSAGGGIENVLSSCGGCEASVKLRNTILAGNFRNGATPSDYSGVDADSTSSFNLIGVGGSGGLTNSINHNQVGVADAKLGPLANNGGPTLTRALLTDSPAVDAGDNCVLDNSCLPPLTSALTTDQRGAGFSRAVDGDGDGAITTDIGAVEIQSLLVMNTNDSGAGSLRQAITDANANASAGTRTINFQAGLTGVINLLTELPDIASDVTIAGPGANLLTVQRSTASGTPPFAIFSIFTDRKVSISGLTISNGNYSGIFNYLGSVVISNCVIDGNRNGIVNRSEMVINDSVVSNNIELGVQYEAQIGATVTGAINNSTVVGNLMGGVFNSGVFASSVSTLTVNHSTISANNFGDGSAGGITTSGFQGGTAITFINGSTISGNRALEGPGFAGGVAALGTGNGSIGTVSITNSTITANAAPTLNSGAAGMIVDTTGSGAASITLRNTIVAGNYRLGNIASDITGTVDPASSFNLIGSGGSGGLTNGVNNNQVGIADARLAPLANNGGPTKTHALLAGSPALDAGNNCVFDNTCAPAVGFSLINDQRGAGFSRRVDGPDADTTDTVDIGAFEAQVSIGNITDQTINEDASLSLPFNVGGAASITSVTASSSNTTLVPNTPATIAISGSGSTRTLTVNPVANLFGTSTITVTVNGNNSQTMTDTFLLTVNSVNDAPSFTKGPNQTVNENAGAQTVNNWATAILAGPANESGQAVNFSISGNSNPSLFAVAPAVGSTGTLTYTPAAGVSGVATITLALMDNGGTLNGGINTSASQSFTITVREGGALQFSAATFSVAENGVNASITVTRTGGSAGEARVNYATGNNTATAGQDYTATSGTLIFADTEITKTFNVPITNDALDEPDETVNLTLTSAAGTGSLGTPTSAVLTITDNDPSPSLSINDVAVTEGNSGTVNATFTVTLSGQTAQTVAVNFATADGTAQTAGSDYSSNSGILIFAPTETTKTVSVAVVGDFSFEPDETFFVNLSPTTNATISDAQGTGTINNDDALGGTFSFSAPVFTVAEIAGSVLISVQRQGDTSQPATVNYATTDVTADGRKDYTPAIGTLRFAAGDSAKDITVLVNIDAFAEGAEFVDLTLSNPTGGAALGVASTASLQIDNSPWSSPPANSIDEAETFVRQHYHDFLNRDPANDPAGLAFWTNQITECQQPGATCNAELRRINVSAAFFLSIEFQETGYFVYRVYKSSYGNISNAPVPVRFEEFLPDTRQIGEGFMVGSGPGEEPLDRNKRIYSEQFVSSARFLTAYPTGMTPADFVDALYAHAGFTPSPDERLSVISEFGGAATIADTPARARALRRVAENPTLKQQEFNKAFVLMQYFGYLRRNPYDPPEANLDFGGYNFWLGKLNEFNGNFVNAEMVKAFLVSGEYRQRFGP